MALIMARMPCCFGIRVTVFPFRLTMKASLSLKRPSIQPLISVITTCMPFMAMLVSSTIRPFFSMNFLTRPLSMRRIE